MTEPMTELAPYHRDMLRPMSNDADPTQQELRPFGGELTDIKVPLEKRDGEESSDKESTNSQRIKQLLSQLEEAREKCVEFEKRAKANEKNAMAALELATTVERAREESCVQATEIASLKGDLGRVNQEAQELRKKMSDLQRDNDLLKDHQEQMTRADVALEQRLNSELQSTREKSQAALDELRDALEQSRRTSEETTQHLRGELEDVQQALSATLASARRLSTQQTAQRHPNPTEAAPNVVAVAPVTTAALVDELQHLWRDVRRQLEEKTTNLRMARSALLEAEGSLDSLRDENTKITAACRERDVKHWELQTLLGDERRLHKTHVENLASARIVALQHLHKILTRERATGRAARDELALRLTGERDLVLRELMLLRGSQTNTAAQYEAQLAKKAHITVEEFDRRGFIVTLYNKIPARYRAAAAQSSFIRECYRVLVVLPASAMEVAAYSLSAARTCCGMPDVVCDELAELFRPRGRLDTAQELCRYNGRAVLAQRHGDHIIDRGADATGMHALVALSATGQEQVLGTGRGPFEAARGGDAVYAVVRGQLRKYSSAENGTRATDVADRTSRVAANDAHVCVANECGPHQSELRLFDTECHLIRGLRLDGSVFAVAFVGSKILVCLGDNNAGVVVLNEQLRIERWLIMPGGLFNPVAMTVDDDVVVFLEDHDDHRLLRTVSLATNVFRDQMALPNDVHRIASGGDGLVCYMTDGRVMAVALL